MELDSREVAIAPQLAALRERTVYVGLLRESPAQDTELGFRTALTEPFVAVLPASHPLAAQRTVRVDQLADCPFVLLPRAVGPSLCDRITGLCADAGFTSRVARHAVEWQTVCALMETGLGVSPAPASIRRIRLKGVAFRGITPATARTRVAVAWRESDTNPLIPGILAALRHEPPTGPAGPAPRWGGRPESTEPPLKCPRRVEVPG
ncbi:LysR family substrate-binding domain-containing protein [Streptomyces hydrogenans]|uniref:LysR family substrate-binding domain-containing protein n=1 Tax=Streptomyces hydrogenans TaxID=1873719 RepID=UPI0035DE13BD